MEIAGGVHSNGLITVNANNTDVGPTTYGGPNTCRSTVERQQQHLR
jgi:hypothetical protein